MQTWNKREEGLKKIPKPPMYKTPLIVRPLKLPRHSYKQATLRLYLNTGDLIKVVLFKNKKRIAVIKRSFE